MPRQQSQGAAAVLAEPESAVERADISPAHDGIYRPSPGLRRILKRQGDRSGGSAEHEARPDLEWAAGHAPPVASLIGAGLAVGAVSGMLELLVQEIQLRLMHQVTWRTLVISRHASWMAVVVASVLTPCLAALLMSPALWWAARRKRQGAAVSRLTWTWDLAGMILAALLVLGPIQIHSRSSSRGAAHDGARRRGSIAAVAGLAVAGVAVRRLLGRWPRGRTAAVLCALAMARGDQRARASAKGGRACTQRALDRAGHAASRSFERVWVPSCDDARARGLGEARHHV